MAKRIIIIGAGIIGSSLALHLARAGADVLVLDSEEQPGGVATPNSWAWINASWGNPEAYFHLRKRSMASWRGLDQSVPGLAVNWCGSLAWDLPPADLQAFAAEHGRWGYGTRIVDRGEALRIEPNLKLAPELAVHVAEEGMVEPVAAARLLLAAAVAAGAEVIYNAHVRWLDEEDGRVTGVVTTEVELQADEVVIAAGVGSVELLKSVGITLDIGAPPGLLVHSEPAPDLLKGLVLSPELHVRQTAEGRLVAGSDFGGSQPGDDPEATAQALFAQVKAMIKGAEDLSMAHYTLGYRPTPGDGFPAIGRPSAKPGVYVAVMHSGVTLAPIVGQFGAAEILSDVRDPLLQPYHPDRLIRS